MEEPEEQEEEMSDNEQCSSYDAVEDRRHDAEVHELDAFLIGELLA